MFFFDSLENGTKFTKNVKRARRIGTRSKFPVVLRYFNAFHKMPLKVSKRLDNVLTCTNKNIKFVE